MIADAGAQASNGAINGGGKGRADLDLSGALGSLAPTKAELDAQSTSAPSPSTQSTLVTPAQSAAQSSSLVPMDRKARYHLKRQATMTDKDNERYKKFTMEGGLEYKVAVMKGGLRGMISKQRRRSQNVHSARQSEETTLASQDAQAGEQAKALHI